MIVLGIDPGHSGGLVWLMDGAFMRGLSMPWKAKSGWDFAAIHTALDGWRPDLIGIELPQTRPGQAHVRANMGGYWVPVTIAGLLGIQVLDVEATDWQREIMAGAKCAGDPKRAARIVAELRFGSGPYPWDGMAKAKAEGIIDAYLIALWTAARGR